LVARFLADVAAALREEVALFFGVAPPGIYELTSLPSASIELLRSSKVLSNMELLLPRPRREDFLGAMMVPPG
jgi:hypothetical protein